MAKPLISLIMPPHRRGMLLHRALNSVVTQEQAHLVEIILISDVIDEETDAVAFKHLREQDIYIRRNGMPGPAASRNLGLKLATGRHVMFLDDDDAWHHQFLTLITSSSNLSQSDLTYTDSIVVKETRPVSGPIKLDELFHSHKDLLNESVYVKNKVHMSSFIFTRSALTGLEFDSQLMAYEDWDFQLAVIEKVNPAYLPIVSSMIHEVDDNTTDRRGSTKAAEDYNAILDYLYIYRRHKAPNPLIQEMRASLLEFAGLKIDKNFL